METSNPFYISHKNSDVDAEPSSQHHTLGKGPNQAAHGNHGHEFPKPSTSPPDRPAIGDIWLVTDMEHLRRRWNGLAWEDQLIGNAALGNVTADGVAPGSVTSDGLAVGAVTTPKISVGAVTTTEIAPGSITTNRLAAGAVTANEIATNAIVSGKIAAGAVAANEIAAGAITTNKLATGAVTANEIAANTITTAKIAAGAITATEISAGAITTSKIAADAITATEIAANAVTATEISAGAVTSSKLTADAIDGKTITGVTINGVTINGGLFKSTNTTKRVEVGDTGAGDETDEVRMFNNGTVVSMRHISGYAGRLFFSVPSAQFSMISSSDGWANIQSGTGGLRYKWTGTTFQCRNGGDTGYVAIQASAFTVSSEMKFKKDVSKVTVDPAPILKANGLHKWKWNTADSEIARVEAIPAEDFSSTVDVLLDSKGKPIQSSTEREAKRKVLGQQKKDKILAELRAEAAKDQYGLIADNLPDWLRSSDGYNVTAVLGFLWDALVQTTTRLEVLEKKSVL